MTYSELLDSAFINNKPKKKKCCSCHKKSKQTVLWTVYHTVLAVELAIIILIEGIELLG